MSLGSGAVWGYRQFDLLLVEPWLLRFKKLKVTRSRSDGGEAAEALPFAAQEALCHRVLSGISTRNRRH